jgi:uncharacterized protein YndB with AHSA1/START domain
MPTARASRRIAAPADELWAVVADPHHLPRWWPRVTRVEDVSQDAFTEVMKTKKGKTVRADYDFVRLDPGTRTLQWDQLIEGTPFAAALASSETEVRLAPVEPGGGLTPGGTPATEVTIELRQQLSGGRAVQPSRGARYGPGFRSRFRGVNLSWGERLVRKAAQATIEDALDGLERISV